MTSPNTPPAVHGVADATHEAYQQQIIRQKNKRLALILVSVVGMFFAGIIVRFLLLR